MKSLLQLLVSAVLLFTLTSTGHSQTRTSGAQMRMSTRVATSSSDSVTVSDCGLLVSYSNAGPIAVSLPDAPTLPAGCWIDFENTGSGTATLTVNGQSTIDGQASVSLTTNQGVRLVTTGVTYLSERGQGQGTSGGSSGGGTTYTGGPSGALIVDNVAHTVDFATGAICLATLACAPTGAFDLSAATVTKPAKNATADPATCSVSEKYFNTTTGKFRNCLTANNWTDESSSSTSGNSGGVSLPASVHLLGTSSAAVGMAATAADIAAISSATGGGSAQAQTVTLSPAVTTLTDNLSVCWVPTAANTGAGPTLQLNSTPAYPIVKNGNAALTASDINPPAKACALFDQANSAFQLQNPQTTPASPSNGPTVMISGTTSTSAKFIAFQLTIAGSGGGSSYTPSGVTFTAVPLCVLSGTANSDAGAPYNNIYCKTAGGACATASTASTLWFANTESTPNTADIICVGN